MKKGMYIVPKLQHFWNVFLRLAERCHGNTSCLNFCFSFSFSFESTFLNCNKLKKDSLFQSKFSDSVIGPVELIPKII